MLGKMDTILSQRGTQNNTTTKHMENKKTAVEWFFKWFNDNPEATHKEYAEAFEQAKTMELAQRIDDYNNGHIDRNNNRFKLPKLNQNETND